MKAVGEVGQGEKGVRLESRNPLLNARAQAEIRQRKGGEDRKHSQEMPPK